MRFGRLLSVEGEMTIFELGDDPGARLRVGGGLYADLRGRCGWSTASDDMTDHALSEIEAMPAAGGARVTLERL